MEVAQKVQKFVESFRLPRNIALPTDADWVRPGKTLGKCFRDEDELPTTHSLPKSIGDALAQSHSLIVICSPETGESPWVRQEIEAFILLHGRERIICVLAAGSSEESIPAVLRLCSAPDTHGAIHETMAHPLAADLRKGNHARKRAELLKIVAGIAGCGLDDLRQRERTRKNRKRACIACGSIAALGLVTALSLATWSASQSTLVAESKSLASLSQEQFARGERFQAIASALNALPSSESNPNRPIAEEAVAALEQALESNPDPTTLWRPTFAIDLDDPIVSISPCFADGWLAALDESGIISIVDLYTGRVSQTIDLKQHTTREEEFSANAWKVQALRKNLVLAASYGPECSLACFNAVSGEVVWENESVPIDGLAVHTDEFTTALFSIMPETSVTSVVIDPATELPYYGFETDAGPFSYDHHFHPCAVELNSEAKTARSFFGYGHLIAVLDFGSETTWTIEHEGKLGISLAAEDNILVETVIQADESSDSISKPYRVVAYSTSSENPGKVLWSVPGEYSETIVGDRSNSTSLTKLPTIECIETLGGQRIVVIAAGCSIKGISLYDGDVIFESEYRNSVITADAIPGTDDLGGFLTAALANGTIETILPFAEYELAKNEYTSPSLPYQIRVACIGQSRNGWNNVAALVEDNPNRLIAYHTDFRDESEHVDYSLDELIAQAHELLAAE